MNDVNSVQLLRRVILFWHEIGVLKEGVLGVREGFLWCDLEMIELQFGCD